MALLGRLLPSPPRTVIQRLALQGGRGLRKWKEQKQFGMDPRETGEGLIIKLSREAPQTEPSVRRA